MNTLLTRETPKRVSFEKSRKLFEQMREATQTPPPDDESTPADLNFTGAPDNVVIAKMMAQSRL